MVVVATRRHYETLVEKRQMALHPAGVLRASARERDHNAVKSRFVSSTIFHVNQKLSDIQYQPIT